MLSFRERMRRVAVALLVTVSAACAPDAVAPNGPSTIEASAAVSAASPSIDASKGASLVSVQAAGRLRPLTTDLSASQVIGPAGGTIEMPAQGFTLVVPPGAVDAPITFTVTALKGRSLAYEFAPHGITFKAPLRFRQSVTTTSVGWGQRVAGGYFPDRALINSTSGKAQVSEVRPASVIGAFIEFDIWHFSGYLVSCA